MNSFLTADVYIKPDSYSFYAIWIIAAFLIGVAAYAFIIHYNLIHHKKKK